MFVIFWFEMCPIYWLLSWRSLISFLWLNVHSVISVLTWFKHHSPYEGRKGEGRDRKIVGSLLASWSGHCGETPKSMGNCLKKQMRVPKDQHLKLSLPSTNLRYAMWMCIQQGTSSRTLRYYVFLLLSSFYMRNSYITDRSQIAYQIISLIFFLGELSHKK